MSGKVLITEVIKETTSYGSPSYVLTVSVSEPENYGENVTIRKPDACFVYQRTIASEPIKNKFIRVASIDDFFALPEATSDEGGDSEGLYRSSSFVARYKAYNSALADKGSILAGLRTFYNNLNTYVDSYSSGETSRSYVFPDYEEVELDNYIATYRGLKISNDNDSEKMATIQTVILPLLNSNVIIYDSIKATADSLLANTNNKLKDITDYTLMQSKVLALGATMDTYDLANAKTLTRFSDISAYFTDIKGWSAAIVDEDVKGLIEDAATNGLAIAAGTGMTEAALSKSEVGNFITSINPSLAKIRNMDASELTDTSVISQLVAVIKSFGDTIALKIEEQNTAIEVLKENIVRRIGEMQVLEAKMKTIRPSIDITNPESAWYLTVNLKK